MCREEILNALLPFPWLRVTFLPENYPCESFTLLRLSTEKKEVGLESDNHTFLSDSDHPLCACEKPQTQR